MLSSFSIENFRGFSKKQTINLAYPTENRPGSGLTVIVGPNGSGKTTFVDAMRLLFGNSAHIDLSHRHEEKNVRFWATLVDSEAGYSLETRSGSPVYRQPEKKNQKLKWVPSRREWARRANTNLMDEDNYSRNLELQQQRAFVDGNFIGRCAALVKDGQQEEFNKILKYILPELESWRIDRDQDQTSIYYKTAFGTSRTADLFSDGVGSVFRVALSLFTAQQGDILIIDEPELSLHPQAQKRMAALIGDISSMRQIIITTHSTYFIHWATLFAGAKIHRFHLPTADGISVRSISTETLNRFKGLARDWQKPQQLDEVAKEIFFADHVVFVEGQEDVGLLSRFISERRLQPLDFFGYGAGGASNVLLFLQMAKEIGITASALFDGDKKEEAEKARNKFPDFNIVILQIGRAHV